MWVTVLKIPKALIGLLDWTVMVVERLLVLGLAFLVFYFGYQLLRGDSTKNQLDVLKALSENWRVGLILLIALFYETVRKFLEEVKEFAGMKREQHGTPTGESSIPNPKAGS